MADAIAKSGLAAMAGAERYREPTWALLVVRVGRTPKPQGGPCDKRGWDLHLGRLSLGVPSFLMDRPFSLTMRGAP
jgi:hypothetical protein